MLLDKPRPWLAKVDVFCTNPRRLREILIVGDWIIDCKKLRQTKDEGFTYNSFDRYISHFAASRNHSHSQLIDDERSQFGLFVRFVFLDFDHFVHDLCEERETMVITAIENTGSNGKN